jgi:hypothetical protein
MHARGRAADLRSPDGPLLSESTRSLGTRAACLADDRIRSPCLRDDAIGMATERRSDDAGTHGRADDRFDRRVRSSGAIASDTMEDLSLSRRR